MNVNDAGSKAEEASTKPQTMVTDLDEPQTTDADDIKYNIDGTKKEIDARLGKVTDESLTIMKTPNDNNNNCNNSVSAKSSVKGVKCVKPSVVFDSEVFWLGVSQVFFGIFMMGFAVYAILHEAAMSLSASGIWTGLIAIITGIFGILATARRCCPIEDKWRKLSQTMFLALSLVSLALSQLVVVLAGLGLARDINNTENEEEFPTHERTTQLTFADSKFSIIIPENYLGILANTALLIVSALECVCALISSYKGARALCPCFKKENITYTGLHMTNNSHALVASWLGKHSPPPQLYVVTSGSTLGKGTKLSGGLPVTPVFTYPPSVLTQQLVGVPLIPAPLGTIPSPMIPPTSKKYPHIYSKHQPKSKYPGHRPIEKTPRPSRSRSRSRSKTREECLTEKDVAKTYTGLDKEMAEQFIERCNSNKKNSDSVSSKTSCDNTTVTSSSSSVTNRNLMGGSSENESTTNSKDFLVK